MAEKKTMHPYPPEVRARAVRMVQKHRDAVDGIGDDGPLPGLVLESVFDLGAIGVNQHRVGTRSPNETSL